MTIGKAIEMADLSAPNELEYGLKAAWLTGLEGGVITDVLEQHRLDQRADKHGLSLQYEDDVFDWSTDPERELQVPPPWDELYVTWLVARIHLENAEIERYNNEALLFEEQLQRWRSYVVRHHRPRGVGALRF